MQFDTHCQCSYEYEIIAASVRLYHAAIYVRMLDISTMGDDRTLLTGGFCGWPSLDSVPFRIVCRPLLQCPRTTHMQYPALTGSSTYRVIEATNEAAARAIGRLCARIKAGGILLHNRTENIVVRARLVDLLDGLLHGPEFSFPDCRCRIPSSSCAWGLSQIWMLRLCLEWNYYSAHIHWRIKVLIINTAALNKTVKLCDVRLFNLGRHKFVQSIL